MEKRLSLSFRGQFGIDVYVRKTVWTQPCTAIDRAGEVNEPDDIVIIPNHPNRIRRISAWLLPPEAVLAWLCWLQSTAPGS